MSLWATVPPARTTERARPTSAWKTTAPQGAHQTQKAYESETSDDEEESSSLQLIKTEVPADVYGCCFIVAMRGLRDGKVGSVVMSWVWVLLSGFLTFVVGQALLLDERVETPGGNFTAAKMSERLWEAMTERPLSRQSDLDTKLVSHCEKQPTMFFALTVQFIWAIRFLGQATESRRLLSLFISCPVKDMRPMTVLEENGSMLVTGLMPLDAIWFSVFLVLPKILLATLIWLAGVKTLAASEDFTDLLFRIVSLHYVTSVESQLFRAFTAHSKREWVSRARVVQTRSGIFRVFLSWPGELLKLLVSLLLLGVAFMAHMTAAKLDQLCNDCVNTCPSTCAGDFFTCGKSNLVG